MGIWYRAGTAAVSNGSPNVTGTGTTWNVYVRPGDMMTFDGGASFQEIASIPSNTSIALAQPYGGATATGLSYAIVPASYRHQIPSDILEQLRLVIESATNVFLTTGMPADGFGGPGSIGLDVVAQALYYNDEGTWTGPIALGLLDGDHGDIVVSAGGFTLTIEAGAVTTVKIADANVTTAKIADGNVTTPKIADANVTTAKIADGNVTTPKIADSNVTTAKIADANVTTPKIADSNVTTAKIADDSVTNAKLANMAAGTVKANTTGGVADPSDVTLSAFKAALAINGGDVANTPAGGVAANTVQGAINELDTEKLDKTGGTVSGNLTVTGNLVVQGDTVTLDTSTIAVEDVVIEVGKNNVGAVAPYLGLKGERNGTDAFWVWNEATDRWTAYTSTDDLETAGTLANIQAATFFGALSGNASTATTWETGRTITLNGELTGVSGAFNGSANLSFSVTINNAAITTVKIADANVTTAKIADANVTTAKIADANVTTAKIADDNVTSEKLAMNLSFKGFMELTELGATPSNPAADKVRLYAFDAAGVTRLGYVDSAGNTTVLATGGGGATPGGAATNVQYNDGAGGFAAEAAFSYDNTTDTLSVPKVDVDEAIADTATLVGLTATAPAANQVRMFARKAGRMLPAFVGPSGLESALQPHFGRNKIGIWTPPGNATTVPGVFGIAAPTATGTATARNVAATNALTRARRLGYVSAATAGALCGIHWTTAQFTVGDGAGLGGFYLEITFGMSSAAALASGRAFIGMSASVAAPTNVEPSTLTNSFGIAKLSTSNNFRLVYGGSSAQTPIDLGSNFPADTLSADLYNLVLFSAPSSGDVHYRLQRLGTPFLAEGTITNSDSTVLPTASTFLAPRLWRTNNAAAQAMGIDIVNVYIETDY